MPVTGVLSALDCTPELLAEAVARGCNMVVTHHPLIFRSVRRVCGQDNTALCLQYALKHDLAIYALHTSVDHIAQGLNRALGHQIGLTELAILVPRQDTLSLLTLFLTPEMAGISDALQALVGKGGSLGHALSGDVRRLEVVFPTHLQQEVLRVVHRTAPPPRYYVQRLANTSADVGAGMIGLLPAPMGAAAFLQGLKEHLALTALRCTQALPRQIHRVAICGGAGADLWRHALTQGADALVTADVKYHTFCETGRHLLLVDVGHYESEVVVKRVIREHLLRSLPSLKVHICHAVTNPVRYV